MTRLRSTFRKKQQQFPFSFSTIFSQQAEQKMERSGREGSTFDRLVSPEIFFWTQIRSFSSFERYLASPAEGATPHGFHPLWNISDLTNGSYMFTDVSRFVFPLDISPISCTH